MIFLNRLRKLKNKGGAHYATLILLISCLGIATSFIVFFVIRKLDKERLRLEFNRWSATYAEAIKRYNDVNLEMLRSVGDLYAASQSVERDEFRIFTRNVLQRHSDILAIDWMPRIADAKRKEFEESLRVEGYPEFQVTERNDQQKFSQSSQRKEYFPVDYTEPMELGRPILGFDTASNPVSWEAMQKARDSGMIIATSQIKLVREKKQSPNYKVFLPIYINGVAHDTLEERRQNLAGFVAILVNIEDFIESSLSDMGSSGIDMYLYDESVESDKQLLYFYSLHRQQTSGVSIGEQKENKELQWIGRFDMAGRKWQIRCVPDASFFARYRKSQSWLVLAIGLLLTFALARYLFNIKGYTAKIESLVTERTDALEKVNKNLKESESMVRAILDQTFQFIGLMSVDGTLIEVNKTAIDLVGIDEAACLNKPFWDAPWWTHSPQLQNKLREAIKKVAAGEFVRFEATHKAKDGSLHYVDFSLKPVKDATGKVIYMIPEGRDITERKVMEERLSATAQEWESTFNSITEFVSIQDKDSRLVKVNKAYAD
jgi:PAS domain S-box-containing protein